MPQAAAALAVSDQELAELEAWLRSPTLPAGLAQRARIVHLAAQGHANIVIAERLGVSRPTVICWRRRFAERGIAGLGDRPRSGRPRTIGLDKRLEVVAATLAGPPSDLGVTHWSSRLLASELGLGHTTVAKIWRDWELQPWRVATFKFSTDPQLEAKIHDVVGLYLHPPERAIVLCVDAKSQIQALERTAPMVPLRPGRAQRQPHDHLRHGTTTLVAALEVATREVIGECYQRHRHAEFLTFLKLMARAYPQRQLHLMLDNYATHKHPTVRAWLERHPRVHLHFTPTSASWMNLVEIFFGILSRQALQRGSFASVTDRVRAIGRFCDAWNQRSRPFTWTKTPDEIHSKTKRKSTSRTRH